MNNTIKTSIAAVAAVFALTGVAHAQEVKIDLLGKDARTIHAEIVAAADKVCRAAIDTSPDFVMTPQSECVSATIEKADAEFARLNAAPPVVMAQASDRAGQR
jgi:hypothetical protein